MLSDQMRYFVAAARHEHLGRAADELDMSQPALSRSILKLEEELGVQLFDRAGRGVRLNAAGKILLCRVEPARAECDDAVRELHEQRNLSRKTVSIGYFATFGVRLIPNSSNRFARSTPESSSSCSKDRARLLAEQLLSGEIDLCIASQFTELGLSWHPCSTRSYSHSCLRTTACETSSIDLTELAEEPFVALKVGHGLRQTLVDLCREAGFTPQIKLEGYEVATLRGLVGAGFGVTLSPKRTIAAPIQAISIPVRTPRCQRMIGLSWRKGRWLSPKTLLFKEHLLKNLSAGPSNWRSHEHRRPSAVGSRCRQISQRTHFIGPGIHGIDRGRPTKCVHGARRDAGQSACLDIVPNVNTIARTVRGHGGRWFFSSHCERRSPLQTDRMAGAHGSAYRGRRFSITSRHFRSSAVRRARGPVRDLR